MFGNLFCFLFLKTCFWKYKKKKTFFFCIFEIKNMFDQLKLKKIVFQFLKKKKIVLKKKKKTKISCYQDLNSNANLLNETDSFNQMCVFFGF